MFGNCDHAEARFNLSEPGNIYGGLTNPTQEAFEKRVAALEDVYKRQMVFSSFASMAAGVFLPGQAGPLEAMPRLMLMVMLYRCV